MGSASSSTGPEYASGGPRRAPARAWIDARGEVAWRVVGGIPLVARIVRSLELEGIREFVIACDVPRTASDFGARVPGTRIHPVRIAAGEPAAGTIADAAGEGAVLCADGALVIDRRLLRALLASPAPCIVPPPPGDDAVGLAWLEAPDAARFGAAPDARGAVRTLHPDQLPVFSAEMRGETPILYRAARTPDGAAAAERALVLATQKHVMDAPARWLDPPVENALVTWIAPTRWTPNHVTIACTLLGFAGAWLLWKGAFAAALPVLYVVGWLDGVDGKLARLRLHYSTVGEWESYFDFAYENAWWIAIAAHFSHAGNESAVLWGAALVGGNLLDEIAYTLGHARLGVALDLLSPADGAFRLIAGRRNIYVAILLAATLLGSPFGGLVAMGAWAVVTGVVHAVRLAVALRSPVRQGLHA